MSVASVSTISLSLAILGGFVLVILWLNSVAASLSNELEMCVFLKHNLPQEEIADAVYKIQSLRHVVSVKHTPAEEVWERAKSSYERYIDLSGVSNVELGDEIRVKLDNPRYMESTARRISTMAGVDEVVAPRKEAKELVRFSRLVEIIGISASGVLLIITAFIISNAIRLTVFARRREIRIMQLVGATNWFIRLPLLFEGTVLGTIGGLISCGIVLGGAWYVTQAVTRAWPLLRHYPGNIDPYMILAGMAGVGCVIGAIGSFISIRRFLRT